MQKMPIPVGGYKLPSGRGVAGPSAAADAKKPAGKGKAPPFVKKGAKAGKK